MTEEFWGGKPDFRKILSLPDPPLSEKESAFLKHSTERLCAQAAEWEGFRRKKIGRKTLVCARKEKFFGLTAPEKWGGLGFSPKAQALILQKIASADLPLAVLASVSNSLGPAKLLLRYGSEEQKKRFLPRLISGEDIPCFALTEPGAGSDISSLSSSGVLFRESSSGPTGRAPSGKSPGEGSGGGRLKIRLNWNKRWISLSAVASLAAIAVRLKDPDRFLDRLSGEEEDLGVSLVLVRMTAPGVKKGRIHDILGVSMGNGPFQGENVILDAEEGLIGGLRNAGRGRRMIDESLSLGRGLAVPSLALGGIMRAVKTAALYARVREQFNRPVGEFEGVKELLARMAGRAFASLALRDFFVSEFSSEAKNGLQTEAALVKHSLTESHQKIIKDGMDILCGKGVSLGPKNSIALLHLASPIFNVVEGSNVLLRSFVIFSRAVLNNHPLFREKTPAAGGRPARSGRRSERKSRKNSLRIVAGSVFRLTRLALRALLLSLSRGFFSFPPRAEHAEGGAPPRFFDKKGRAFMRKLSWSAALSAFFTEIFLLRHGSRFAVKESVCARFADILSAQYRIAALLWRCRLQALSPSEELAAEWALQDGFYQIQTSFERLIQSARPPFGFAPFKALLLLAARINALGAPPDDRLSMQTASALLSDSRLFQSLVRHVLVSKDPEDSLNKLEKAAHLKEQSQAEARKLKLFSREGRFKGMSKEALIRKALEQDIVQKEEADRLLQAEQAAEEALQADAFSPEEYYPPEKNRPDLEAR